MPIEAILADVAKSNHVLAVAVDKLTAALLSKVDTAAATNVVTKTPKATPVTPAVVAATPVQAAAVVAAPTPVQTAAIVAEPPVAPANAVAFTQEQVIHATISAIGNDEALQAGVAAILSKYSAARVTLLDPSFYAAYMADLSDLTSAQAAA